jgi:hypothetical protein
MSGKQSKDNKKKVSHGILIGTNGKFIPEAEAFVNACRKTAPHGDLKNLLQNYGVKFTVEDVMGNSMFEPDESTEYAWFPL